VWNEVDPEARIETTGANVSGIDDGAISTSDGDRSRKLSRTIEVLDTVGAGEGRARVRNPGFCSAGIDDGSGGG
jgi:hypothetical protein